MLDQRGAEGCPPRIGLSIVFLHVLVVSRCREVASQLLINQLQQAENAANEEHRSMADVFNSPMSD